MALLYFIRSRFQKVVCPLFLFHPDFRFASRWPFFGRERSSPSFPAPLEIVCRCYLILIWNKFINWPLYALFNHSLKQVGVCTGQPLILGPFYYSSTVTFHLKQFLLSAINSFQKWSGSISFFSTFVLFFVKRSSFNILVFPICRIFLLIGLFWIDFVPSIVSFVRFFIFLL